MTSFGLALWASVHTAKPPLGVSVKATDPKRNSLPQLSLPIPQRGGGSGGRPSILPPHPSRPHPFLRWPPSPSLSSILPQPGWQSPGRQRVASLLRARPRSPRTRSLGQAAPPEAPEGPPAPARGSGLEPPRIHARLASTRGPGARPARPRGTAPTSYGPRCPARRSVGVGLAPGSGWADAHLDPLHAGLQLQLLHQALQGAHAGPGRHGG